MGFFSWHLADKPSKAVRNRWTSKGPTPCKMIDDKGNEWVELNYNGYGEFQNKPYYELLAEMNSPDPREIESYEGDLTSLGIDLAFSGDDSIKKPKIVSIDCDQPWEDLPDSPIAECQGFF